MRFSLLQATAIALVGTGRFLLGASGAPAGLSPVIDHPASCEGLDDCQNLAIRAGGWGLKSGRAPTPNSPVVFTEGGHYRYEIVMASFRGKTLKALSTKNGVHDNEASKDQNTIDQIQVVDKGTDRSLIIMNAFNRDNDFLARGSPGYFYANQVIMSLYRDVAGKDPMNMNVISMTDISEQGTREVLNPLWAKEPTFTAKPGSSEYEAIMGTTWGKFVLRTIQDTELGKSVVEITATQDGARLDFRLA